jgi:nucleotide-binding universal stress UspA family protein
MLFFSIQKETIIMLTFKNILYVYSDDADNTTALTKAVLFAKENHANLTVLFTLTEDSLSSSLGFSKKEIVNGLDALDLQRDKILRQFSNFSLIQQDSIPNDSFIAVIKKVNQHKFDLLIKPSRNEGLIGKVFGCNDMEYLRQCPCPVWLINPESHENTQNPSVIAAVDVDRNYPEAERDTREQLNLAVVSAAVTLAMAKGCSLKIVSIWPVPSESRLRHSAYIKQSSDDVNAYVKELGDTHKQNLDAFMTSILKNLGKEVIEYISPESIAIKGNPREMLPTYANQVNAELVVMGTIARVGISGLIIGNTAENILYRLNQSVLAIKPEGFKTLVA